MENVARKFIFKTFAELAKSLVKCDYLLKHRPEVLKEELGNPRYRIIYDENDKIIGRNDIILKILSCL